LPSYLENVGQVPEVEDVVELDGGGQEGLRDTGVHRHSTVDQGLCVALQLPCHAGHGKVLYQNAGVDSAHRFVGRETACKHCKVTLKRKTTMLTKNMQPQKVQAIIKLSYLPIIKESNPKTSVKKMYRQLWVSVQPI
jgi:hypothetical protein